ncbi:MAG: OmpA family protein [Paludibacteraceae bacterium]|nr:OmpA family protein [Paludibacteraceae bacterium]
MQINKIFSLIAAAALTVSVSAQQSEHDNYIGVNFGGGLNSALYKPANGTHGLGFGFDAGLHYGHFFNKTVGLGVGLQFSWANAYATYNWNEVTTGLTHPSNPNTPYNLTTGFNDFKERQNIGYLSIPVEVLFRKGLNDRAAFIGGVGLALDLPLYGKYIAKSGSYSTTGVFPALGNYALSDMPEHGFSTYTTTQDAKWNNRAKVGGSVIADLGFRVAMNDNWGMYFGLYAGYGFTNLLGEEKTEEMLMINAANPAVIDYRGTFDSNEASKANLLRAGVKIAIDFGWGKKSDKVTKDQVLSELAAAQEKARLDSIASAEAQAKADSLAAAEAENARIAAAKAEQERIARERAAAENARIAAEKAAQEAEAARIATEKARIAALKSQGETVNVHFDIAGADMHFRDGEQAVVDEICHVMAADPSMKIVITGHTDNTGNAEQNLNYFGMKRAESLKNYMVEKGVPAGQIRCESKGQLEPVADNATREGRAINRRANIRFE